MRVKVVQTKIQRETAMGFPFKLGSDEWEKEKERIKGKTRYKKNKIKKVIRNVCRGLL